jgi:prevent-host-death family protein
MKTIRARHAKMRFFELIDAAEQGCSTTITRRGVPVAVIVPIADARKIYLAETPSFVDFLLTFPGGVEFERDSGRLHDLDL